MIRTTIITCMLAGFTMSGHCQDKKLTDVIDSINKWRAVHSDFRMNGQMTIDGVTFDSTYLLHNSKLKCKVVLSKPVPFAYILYSPEPGQYLTYLPLTDVTLPEQDPTIAELTKLIDWRVTLSQDSATKSGFSLELKTNASPFCIEFAKKGASLICDLIADENGKIISEIIKKTENKKEEQSSESYTAWNFDGSATAAEFDSIAVKPKIDKGVDFQVAMQNEWKEVFKHAKSK